MYKNIRDVASMVLGLGFMTLAALCLLNVIEYDQEKHSLGPPLILGIALVVLGGVPFYRRRGRASSSPE